MAKPIPLIDVEQEWSDRTETENLSIQAGFHIPSIYISKLSETGLLKRFNCMVQGQITNEQRADQVLRSYGVILKPSTITGLIQSGMFEDFVNTLTEVYHERYNK